LDCPRVVVGEHRATIALSGVGVEGAAADGGSAVISIDRPTAVVSDATDSLGIAGEGAVVDGQRGAAVENRATLRSRRVVRESIQVDSQDATVSNGSAGSPDPWASSGSQGLTRPPS